MAAPPEKEHPGEIWRYRIVVSLLPVAEMSPKPWDEPTCTCGKCDEGVCWSHTCGWYPARLQWCHDCTETLRIRLPPGWEPGDAIEEEPCQRCAEMGI